MQCGHRVAPADRARAISYSGPGCGEKKILSLRFMRQKLRCTPYYGLLTGPRGYIRIRVCAPQIIAHALKNRSRGETRASTTCSLSILVNFCNARARFVILFRCSRRSDAFYPRPATRARCSLFLLYKYCSRHVVLRLRLSYI